MKTWFLSTLKPPKLKKVRKIKQPSAASLGSILAILLLYLPCYVQARDFYVSNDGLDNNPGTREEPFRTLARGALGAEGGDTVILRGGIYRETLSVRHSGTDTKPLTFMAAKGEKVVISGADLAEDWRAYKGAYESGGARWVPGVRGRAEQGDAPDAGEPPR